MLQKVKTSISTYRINTCLNGYINMGIKLIRSVKFRVSEYGVAGVKGFFIRNNLGCLVGTKMMAMIKW